MPASPLQPGAADSKAESALQEEQDCPLLAKKQKQKKLKEVQMQEI